MTMMEQPHPNDTFRTIHSRHSVRLFTPDPILEADLEAVLEAANRAPSAHNQQSWRFIILKTEDSRRRLAALASERAAGFPRPSSTLLRMAARSILSAPVVVAVANTGELIRRADELLPEAEATSRDFFRTMEIQSSAAAVENLLLAATSLGIGSVWLGILFLIKEEVLDLLGEPSGEFMAVVPLGYPARGGEGPKKRPLDVLIRYLD